MACLSERTKIKLKIAKVIGVFIISIISVMMAVTAYMTVRSLANNYISLINSWQTDFVFEVSQTLKTGNETQPFIYNWPGTMQGCDCTNINQYNLIYYNL
jgi:hypothetical protein